MVCVAVGGDSGRIGYKRMGPSGQSASTVFQENSSILYSLRSLLHGIECVASMAGSL